MSEETRSCPSCGAHVPPEADACDLCGTPIEPAEGAEEGAAEADLPEAGDAVPEDPSAAEGDAEEDASVFCHQCGWENPREANFCSQCGTELQNVSEASTPEGTRNVEADLPSGTEPSASSEGAPSGEGDGGDETEDEQVAMGRQIAVVVGAALVLVLGLFFATQWSQQYQWGSDGSSGEASAATTPSATGGAGASGSSGGPAMAGGPSSGGGRTTDLATLVEELSGSVDGPMAGQIDSLRAVVEEASGTDQRQVRAKLAQLYVGAGAPGRAALVQQDIAKQTGRVEDRRRAANLLYKWMRQVEQQGDRANVADVARHVAEAYAGVVEQRPQDLDARTRMGEAYLLTNNPMRGIQAINQVLEDDSTFVPARFQKGLALLQINRLDQAVRQFERVMEHASQDDPFYQQAKRAITVIREQAGSSGENPSSGA